MTICAFELFQPLNVGAAEITLDDDSTLLKFIDDLSPIYCSPSPIQAFDRSCFNYVLLNVTSIFEKGKSCLHPEKECSIFHNLPPIPHADHPLDIFQGKEWDENLDKNYGPNNAAHFSSQLPIGEECSADQHDQSKDIIFTMAQGYHCNHFTMVLRSLRASGCTSKVVLFRSHSDNDPCADVISSCGDVELAPSTGFDAFSMETRRVFLTLSYLHSRLGLERLRGEWSCSRMVLMDFRDIYFQRNPFDHLPTIGADVVISEEGFMNFEDPNRPLKGRMSIGKEGLNIRWLNHVSQPLIGRDLATEVAEMPILNSGFIIGSSQGLYKLMLGMAYVMKRSQVGSEDLTTQGTPLYISVATSR